MSSSPEEAAGAGAEASLPNDEEDSTTTQLKSALWLRVGQLVDAATLSLSDKNATPQFIGALTELLWHQIVETAVDVEAFARHAGRTTVTAEDVLLLARRNDEMQALLENHLQSERRKQEAAATAGAENRGAPRGRGAGGGRGRGKARGRGS